MIDNFTGKYFFLSNFYKHPIMFEGLKYPSSEHAYQASKTLYPDVKQQCLYMSCGECKKWGRNIKMRDDWNNVKLKIMRTILNIKFSDLKLKSLLLETSSEELIEGNTWNDTYWGVCNSKGSNHLGKLLMEIRQSFQNEDILKELI